MPPQLAPPRRGRRPGRRLLGEAVLVLLAITVELSVWADDRDLRWGGRLPALVVPVLTVAVLGLLPLRWRHPTAVFAVQCVFATTSLVVPEFEPFTGLLIALYAVARRGSTRASAVALACCAFPFGIDSYNVSWHQPTSSPASMAVPFLLFAVLAGTVWGLARLSRLSERRAELLRALEAARAAQAVHEERMRLARELHDAVAGAVSGIVLQAAGAGRSVPAEHDAVRRALGVIEAAGAQALDELHRLLRLLHTDGDLAPAATPGLDDLPAMLELARSGGLRITAVEQGEPLPVDRGTQLAAYRVVQEAITNTTKHAGAGAATAVELCWEQAHLVVTVRDRTGGPGTAPRQLSSGHGLAGMHERVREAGGELHTEQLPDGFLVRARLPLDRRQPRVPVAAG